MPKNMTAAEAVQSRATEARTLLAQLAERVDAIEGEAAERPHHWGYAGDLAHIAEQLRHALGIEG